MDPLLRVAFRFGPIKRWWFRNWSPTRDDLEANGPDDFDLLVAVANEMQFVGIVPTPEDWASWSPASREAWSFVRDCRIAEEAVRRFNERTDPALVVSQVAGGAYPQVEAELMLGEHLP